MVSIFSMGATEAAQLAPMAGFELGRGAIAGAFIAAAAFLAGLAAMRRSALAVYALLMVLGAGALQFSWLVLSAAAPETVTVLFLGLFGAAAVIYFSTTIAAMRDNALWGGFVFTAALVIAGLGLINFIDRVNVASLMRSAVISAGLLGVGVAVWRALSGDQGARLVLPGLALIVASPFAGSLGAVSGEAVSLLPHALFTLGVLGASIAAFAEETHFKNAARPFLSDGMSMGADAYETAHGSAPEYAAPPKQGHKGQERAEIALDSQLARVLDYSGVAVWDWSPEFIDQTESLPRILGADRAAPFTPDALRNFIHKDDIARFESEILAPAEGPFDAALKLFDGRKIRMRGARAADEESGSLERLVAFIEAASPIFKPSEESGVDGAKVQMATKAAIVPSTAGLVVQNLAQALERGDIVAAFQPIVSLKDEKIVGYEALARWPGQGKTMKEGPATFAKAADIAGKGGVLAQTMLDQAAAFLVEQRKSADRKDIFVALNVTWGQMRGEGFVEAVRETIARCGLEKNALVLELTEGDAVTDDDEAGKIFTALRNAGAALAFDDFGAGFSCLSNLRKYDFDYLKIDKSFAADLERKGDGAKIVGCLTRLGKELGLKVIVEGIETKTAAKAAAALGCAYAQGYALGAPTGGESKSATAAALSPKNGPAATDKNNAQAQKGAGNADNGDVASAPESAPAKTESLVQEPAPANESQRMRWVLRRR